MSELSRGSRPASCGGTSGLAVPDDAPRQRRGYTPINFLNAFPPFQLFICFSLINASFFEEYDSVYINLKGILCFVDRCFPEL